MTLKFSDLKYFLIGPTRSLNPRYRRLYTTPESNILAGVKDKLENDIGPKIISATFCSHIFKNSLNELILECACTDYINHNGKFMLFVDTIVKSNCIIAFLHIEDYMLAKLKYDDFQDWTPQ